MNVAEQWLARFEEMERFQTEKQPVLLTGVQVAMLVEVLSWWRRDVNDNNELAALAEVLAEAS